LLPVPCFAAAAGFVLVAIASSFSLLLSGENADQAPSLLRDAFRAGAMRA